MAKRKPDQLEDIDLAKLDTVTGGAARMSASAAGSSGSSTSSGTGVDPQLMSVLTSIESSLSAMTQQANPMQEMLQMFEIMRGMNPSGGGIGVQPQPAPQQYWAAVKK